MYRLDRVLSPSEGQPAVGHEVLPLIEAAMDGSSAAVVLYGAKISGKAFTAIGEKKKRLSYAVPWCPVSSVYDKDKGGGGGGGGGGFFFCHFWFVV